MTSPGSLSPLSSFSEFDTPCGAQAAPPASARGRARFGEHAPKLPARRARVVTAVHATLTLLALGYLLWANYVIFTGGNAPLTPWHLSDGDTGTGAFMLFIGDWLSLLVFQLCVNGPIEYTLCGLLQPRDTAIVGGHAADAIPLTPLTELLSPPGTLWTGVIPPQPGSPWDGPEPPDRRGH
jgi:hypothetical protein